MNLEDFLKYKTHCPLCSNKLNLVFHSRKRQKIRQENNRILITFAMTPLNMIEKTYNVGFSIDPHENSFFIEFYTDRGVKFEEIPVSLLKKFHSFNTNLGAYKFYRFCNCGNYHYESNYFCINLQTLNIGDLIIDKERFYFYYDGYKEFELLNNYTTNKSLLGINRYQFEISPQTIYNKPDWLEFSLLKFTSKEEIVERINKLLVFS